MAGDHWKVNRICESMGVPFLDIQFIPPHVLMYLKEQAAELDDLGALILYGSTVRGDASGKSDIDILVIPLKKELAGTLEKVINDLLRDIEERFKLEINFSSMIYDGTEDPYFIWETLKDGAVIYCRPEMVLPAIDTTKPYALISYRFAGLDESKKKRIQRFLYESKSGMGIEKRNRMEYIAPGVIIVPIGKSKRIVDYFDSIELDYSLLKIWI